MTEPRRLGRDHPVLADEVALAEESAGERVGDGSGRQPAVHPAALHDRLPS